MLPCLILGDSIAGGTGMVLHETMMERCAVISRIGASTLWVLAAAPRNTVRTAVISTGSNDARASDLPWRLATLRAGVAARRVVWILPYDRYAAELIRQVATAHGDAWVDVARTPAASDGVHPRSYVPIALAAGAAIAASLPGGDPERQAGRVPSGVDPSTGIWGATADVAVFP